MSLVFCKRDPDLVLELEVTWSGLDYIDPDCRQHAAECPAHAPESAVSLGVGRYEARHTRHSAKVAREQKAARMGWWNAS